MKSHAVRLTYQIELENDEELILPESLREQIGKGRWLITVEPLEPGALAPIRNHSAFLNSYALQDEGLYDDYPPR